MKCDVPISAAEFCPVLEICDTISVKTLSNRKCFNIQKAYIIPEVNKFRITHNEAVLAASTKSGFVEAGGWSSTSPCACAKDPADTYSRNMTCGIVRWLKSHEDDNKPSLVQYL